MKRFHFPLRPVGVLRAHRETRAREVFGAAIQQHGQAEAALTETRARVARLEAALFQGREGRFNAAEETHRLHAYRREAAAEVEAGRVVVAARDLLNRRRAEYLEAHRQLEVVQRLETRARTAHRQAANREEQAEFDDFATRRAGHREAPFSS